MSLLMVDGRHEERWQNIQAGGSKLKSMTLVGWSLVQLCGLSRCLLRCYPGCRGVKHYCCNLYRACARLHHCINSLICDTPAYSIEQRHAECWRNSVLKATLGKKWINSVRISKTTIDAHKIESLGFLTKPMPIWDYYKHKFSRRRVSILYWIKSVGKPTSNVWYDCTISRY